MTAIPERRGRIQTVCGVIDATDLGPTLMHEHLLCDLTPPDVRARGIPDTEITLANCWEIRRQWGMQHPVDLRLEDERLAEAELADFRAAGGSGVIELTCGAIKRNPQGLRRISQATGVHVVMGCGYYTDEFESPATRTQPTDRIAREIVDDLTRGTRDGGVVSGIIGEIGCSHPWTEFERRVLWAGAQAQRETGASLNVHPGRHPDSPVAHVALVNEAGGDATRTIVSHVERTIFELDGLLRLADTGCVIEFDLFGIESSYFVFEPTVDLPNDGIRLNMIRELIRHGHRDQVVVSHDICTRTRLRRYGGHGYTHILEHVVPLMRIKDFSEDDIQAILVDNPRRCLAFV